MTYEIQVDGIEKAEEYIKNNVLKIRARRIVDKTLKIGVDTARKNLMHKDTGATLASIHKEKVSDLEGKVVAGGNAVWIEFGTGVIRNSSEHPWKAQFGLSPHGTYGKGHGSDPNGWYYPDPKGKYEYDGKRYSHTRGIEMNPFMLEAYKAMKAHIKSVARGK